jgi:hypothetical protein
MRAEISSNAITFAMTIRTVRGRWIRQSLKISSEW